MSKLKKKAKFEREAIRRELGPIVYGYRDLFQKLTDKSFRAKTLATVDAVRSAALALKELEQQLSNLPDTLQQRFVDSLTFFQKTVPALKLPATYTTALEHLAVLQAELRVLALALTQSTGIGGQRRKRGKPRLPYAYPTMALMRAWTGLTGQSIVFPKQEPGKDSATWSQATQPSTEFIRLGLKMIDPKSTRSHAASSIRRIMDIDKRLARVGSSIASIRAECPDLFTLATLWGKAGRLDRDHHAKQSPRPKNHISRVTTS